MNTTRRAGFTIIELIVGLAIMLMMAAVVAPVSISALDRARIDRAAKVLENFADGIGAFKTDVKEWPGQLSQLSDPITTSQANLCGRYYNGIEAARWLGPYVNRVIPSTGVLVGIGTAENQLTQDPRGTPTDNLIKITIPSVSEGDAILLNEVVDGDNSSSGGTVHWTAPDSRGLVTTYYYVPATRCP